ncbi:MAG: type II toxin-antitoxin system RelE/ParE family toxin [Chitinophagales bacterium]
MKIEILKSFSNKLEEQVDYIAQDKPGAARKFKNDVLQKLKKLKRLPYAHRKSIFFNRNNIRDLIFKGYIIVYKVDERNKKIIVFGLSKYKDDIK